MRSTIDMMAVDQLTEAMYDQSRGGAGGAYFFIDAACELTGLYGQQVITSSARGLSPRGLEISHEILD